METEIDKEKTRLNSSFSSVKITLIRRTVAKTFSAALSASSGEEEEESTSEEYESEETESVAMQKETRTMERHLPNPPSSTSTSRRRETSPGFAASTLPSSPLSSCEDEPLIVANPILSTEMLDESEEETILPKPIDIISPQILDDDSEEVIIMPPKNMEAEKGSPQMEEDAYESGTHLSISRGDEPILSEVPKKKSSLLAASIPFEKENNIRSRQAIIRSIKSVIGEKRPLEDPLSQIPGVPPSKLSYFRTISLAFCTMHFN